MKRLTVVAAALAAGMMTFAANAREAGPTGFHKPGQAGRGGCRAGQGREGREDRERPDGGRGVSRRESQEPEIRYKSIIERYASLYGVPVSLAHAVITVESNYRPIHAAAPARSA